MAESQNIEWKRSWKDKYLETEQLLGFHSSYPRNPLIADACFKAGYIDSWGRGIEKVTEACRAAGLPKPHFEESQSGMQVTLFAKARPESGPELKSESKHAESGLGSDTKKSRSEGAGVESGPESRIEGGSESKKPQCEGGTGANEGANGLSEGASSETEGAEPTLGQRNALAGVFHQYGMLPRTDALRTSFKVLRSLADRPRQHAAELADVAQVAKSTVERHLASLKKIELIEIRGEGKSRVYELTVKGQQLIKELGGLVE